MKVLQKRIPAACLLFASCVMVMLEGAYGVPAAFLPSQYPSHPDDPTCQSAAGARICDPQSILTPTSINSLSESLKDNRQRRIELPENCFRGDENTSNELPVQYGVAVLRKVSNGCYRCL